MQQDFDAGHWISHGDGRKAQRDRELFSNRPSGTRAVHEKAQGYGSTGRGFTRNKLIDRTGHCPEHIRMLEGAAVPFGEKNRRLGVTAVSANECRKVDPK